MGSKVKDFNWLATKMVNDYLIIDIIHYSFNSRYVTIYHHIWTLFIQVSSPSIWKVLLKWWCHWTKWSSLSWHLTHHLWHLNLLSTHSHLTNLQRIKHLWLSCLWESSRHLHTHVLLKLLWHYWCLHRVTRWTTFA